MTDVPASLIEGYRVTLLLLYGFRETDDRITAQTKVY